MVSNLQAHQVSRDGWRLTWETDVTGGPVFRVYRDGHLLLTTMMAEALVTITAGETPVFEVLDGDEGDPGVGYPGRVTVTWWTPEGGNAVDHYLVQQFVGGEWVTRRRVPETGAGCYRWESAYLADDAVHQFRVLGVGRNQNNGTAASLSVLCVRHPNPPVGAYTYDAVAGTVTIADPA